MAKNALIVGATGLIGNHLLELLLNSEHYDRVFIITRRPLDRSHDKLVELLTDFDNLDKLEFNEKIDDVFCCLGITMKKAGSKEVFRKVDFEYPLQVADLLKSQGANSYHLVSALGADEHSNIFYNKVKGEVEKAIKNIGYSRYHIYRPSLLFGDRKEFRLGERLGIILFKSLSFLFIGPIKKYKGIDAVKIARAMVHNAQDNKEGLFIHESNELQNY